MISKKVKILLAALELFSDNGFTATSTSKIAQRAGVSEGLIFRHFQNKKGLLEAIMSEAEQKLGTMLFGIISENEPEEVLKKSISLPFNVPEDDYDFWRLQFKLKWEQAYNSGNKLQPLTDKLSWAFTKLDFENPNHEAFLLSNIIEGMAISILRDGVKKQESFRLFLLKKYKV